MRKRRLPGPSFGSSSSSTGTLADEGPNTKGATLRLTTKGNKHYYYNYYLQWLVWIAVVSTLIRAAFYIVLLQQRDDFSSFFLSSSSSSSNNQTATATTTKPSRSENDATTTAPFTMSAEEFRSLLYYNLSCPFEWSKYSCIHQGQSERAAASRELLVQHRQTIIDLFGMQSHLPVQRKPLLPRNSRLVLTGDSLMRQVFVSLACLLHSFGNTTSNTNATTSMIQDARVDWMYSWPCHNTINCVAGGPHSGFSVGSLWLTNGAEIHFLPHGGASRSKQEEDMYERFERELLDNNDVDTTINNITNNYNATTEPGHITLGKVRKSALPSRHGVELSHRDILVASVGIHYSLRESEVTAQRLARIGQALQQQQQQQQQRSHSTTALGQPQLWYMTTPTQHFDTADGQYERNHSNTSQTCTNTTRTNPRLEMEQRVLRSGGGGVLLMEYNDLDFGYAHIGHGDCSHYCMPGPPDLVALRLLQRTASLTF
eukprot:scaffold8005_cov275-Amphora_coffeaeformis.AAC.31